MEGDFRSKRNEWFVTDITQINASSNAFKVVFFKITALPLLDPLMDHYWPMFIIIFSKEHSFLAGYIMLFCCIKPVCGAKMVGDRCWNRLVT